MKAKQAIAFLEAYLKELRGHFEAFQELSFQEIITPETILAEIPTKRQTLEKLKKRGGRFAVPKICRIRANRIVALEKQKAERQIEALNKPCEKAMFASRLAKEHGFDGGMFFRRYEDPTSTPALRHLSKLIETVPQIISAIKKPPNRSAIPNGVELLNIPQVALVLNCAESVVRDYNNKGLLPLPIRIGGAIQWQKKELDNWLVADCPPRQKWEQIKQGRVV